MNSIRDIFVEALAMKVQGKPSSDIKTAIINYGHDLGHSQIVEIGNGESYQLTFDTGEKIRFDGANYFFERG